MNSGQIEFVTFHQSFTYEDFIEGIKPVMDSDSNDPDLRYEITDGVFKRICKSASESLRLEEKGISAIALTEETLQKANFFKVSLGDSQNPNDSLIYDYCIKNQCIAIGYGEDYDFSSSLKEDEVLEAFRNNENEEATNNSYGVIAIKCLKFWMKKGDVVFASNGNREVRAIGIIDGEYEFRKESDIRFHQFRPVKWIYTDLNLPVQDVYSKFFSQQTIYGLYSNLIKKDFFRVNVVSKKEKPFILIIDEINRGNVSSVFGELITLIEADKRTDSVNELRLRLPYSKELFSVPKNLYLLGTMNTADRSVEALDTALRRRFSFIEMPPKDDFPSFEETVHGYQLKDILNTINGRIEKLLNKDHLIGHAYFLKIDGKTDKERENQLKDIFQNKILPLLQEYFFGDFGKIGLVMGAGFVHSDKEKSNAIAFADFDHDAKDQFEEREVYRIANVLDPRFNLQDALQQLMFQG